MNIIVHYPTSEEDMLSLQKSVARVHTQTVADYVQNLTCSKEQKLELISAMQKGVRETL